MAKIKYTGAGAHIFVDQADNATMVDLGCTFDMTVPPQQRNTVEMTCQQDDAQTNEPGIEQPSQCTFTEPLDYAFSSPLIDDFYASKAVKDWEMVFTRGANTQTVAFSGWVSALVPASAGGSDPLQRSVTIEVDTATITYTNT